MQLLLSQRNHDYWWYLFFLWTVFAKASCSAEMAVRSGVLALLYSLFLISGNVFSDITSFNDVCLVNIKFLSLFRNVVLLSQSKLKCKQMGKLKLLLRPQYWHRFMCPAYIYTRENLIVSWYIYISNERLNRNLSGEMYNKIQTKLRRWSLLACIKKTKMA